MITIRNYNSDTDYLEVSSLYKESKTFGGQFDEARDSEDRLKNLVKEKPNAILVAEIDNEIVGTVTLFEDGRSAWLYRFAIKNEENKEIGKALWKKAKEEMKNKGHSQVLVYAPVGDLDFENRYKDLGFNKGNDFTAYWQDLDNS